MGVGHFPCSLPPHPLSALSYAHPEAERLTAPCSLGSGRSGLGASPPLLSQPSTHQPSEAQHGRQRLVQKEVLILNKFAPKLNPKPPGGGKPTAAQPAPSNCFTVGIKSHQNAPLKPTS